MANAAPSSVTLIFYKLGPLSEEPFLNILASAMQMSSLCHCEIAIGESVGSNGEMVNVARVFNDRTGVVISLHDSNGGTHARPHPATLRSPRAARRRSSRDAPGATRNTATCSWAARCWR